MKDFLSVQSDYVWKKDVTSASWISPYSSPSRCKSKRSFPTRCYCSSRSSWRWKERNEMQRLGPSRLLHRLLVELLGKEEGIYQEMICQQQMISKWVKEDLFAAATADANTGLTCISLKSQKKSPIRCPFLVTKHSFRGEVHFDSHKGPFPCFLSKTIHSYQVLSNQEINSSSLNEKLDKRF